MWRNKKDKPEVKYVLDVKEDITAYELFKILALEQSARFMSPEGINHRVENFPENIRRHFIEKK